MTPGLLSGNRITLLQNGREFFPALQAAIDAAQHEVHLETYIFADDPTGRTIAAALSRAALRGVNVRLMLDGFGCKTLPHMLLNEMRRDGVEILIFRPEPGLLHLRRNRLRRLHRKLCMADARIAFVGGINIIDDMDTPGQIPPRYDYAVQVEGPILAQIVPVMRRLWKLVKWTQGRRRSRLPHSVVHTAPAGDQHAALLIRDNLRHRRDIEQAYLDAISAARSEIIIANAYFLPGIRFRRTLIEAAERGVRVTLLLQGRVEYRLLHYATRALYGQFLAAGIKICEYHKSFLHAKVAVIDRYWATVGSSNIDPFSLLLAREANVVVEDSSFAAQLRASLQTAMDTGSQCLIHDSWVHRPWYKRSLVWLAYGTVRFMMGMLGYGKQS
ncbi:cardiolipin synthase B [Sulfuriferula plumbiphila]|uniref:Cardiolipin synthase B n=1 Tax=Sulfuriferula plumbiphila TaxID=171865 RepID=A0A512LBM4_9PROT|nr:cardiolipin synthase ClsB [Sulfuriferula plumbiphila]BBP03334.1 cardiolipin synthase B [Sulfuriferula plumbiphila]GEP31899.1 cardiolipin synthase B [Sulfuriferula plumbiphila]